MGFCSEKPNAKIFDVHFCWKDMFKSTDKKNMSLKSEIKHQHQLTMLNKHKQIWIIISQSNLFLSIFLECCHGTPNGDAVNHGQAWKTQPYNKITVWAKIRWNMANICLEKRGFSDFKVHIDQCLDRSKGLARTCLDKPIFLLELCLLQCASQNLNRL